MHMRKLLAAATAALGLLGATTGQVQAQSHHDSFRSGSFHATGDRGSFRGDRGGFRGDRGGFRGDRGDFRGDRGGFRGDDRGSFRGGFRDDDFAAGFLGFGLGAALASPYYYGSGYGYYYGDDYGYDDPAYGCGAWRWSPYRHRYVWVNGCY
jgi:hypothetical protein